MTDVLIYSKPGCHLCETVKEQLSKLQKQHPFRLLEINILDDPGDYERFKEEIPVVFIAGRKAFKYTVDPNQFLRRLARIERSGGPDAT
jgi:glutaredoxin